MTPNPKQIGILLVEDNPGDVRLIQEALEDTEMSARMTLARDGEEALAVLKGEAGREEVARPDLIILDLNLPKMDGREVLAEVKSDPSTRTIPVVVLTSSSAEQDVLRCYDLHANCYIVKPVGFKDFTKTLQSIERFWLDTVTLPSRG